MILKFYKLQVNGKGKNINFGFLQNQINHIYIYIY
jgi:hypothetical protein